MKKDDFQKHLEAVTARLVERSAKLVVNDLHPPFRYTILLNQSFDGNPLAAGEHILKELRARGAERIGPLSEKEVVEFLWRDEMVPEWIDVTPFYADAAGILFELRCCGRHAREERLLYHVKEGFPPFHQFGPSIPPHWESLEKDGRFDLNWHAKREKAKASSFGRLVSWLSKRLSTRPDHPNSSNAPKTLNQPPETGP